MKKDNNIESIFLLPFFIIIFVLGGKSVINLAEGIYMKMNNIVNQDSIEWNGSIRESYPNYFAFRADFVNMNGEVHKLLHQREMNGIVKLNNGYLVQVCKEGKAETIEQDANVVNQYNMLCKQWGGHLLYVQPAYKISAYDPELPAGVEDYSNQNIETMLNYLKSYNIDIIDLRKEMHNDGIDQYNYYYRTDHHWNTEGGFYAYTKIAGWIYSNSGGQLDENLLDIKNYSIVRYKGWHLGSSGQRVGKAFAGIDDYDLICPNFNTDIKNVTSGYSDSFENMLVNEKVFENKDEHNRYTYDNALSKTNVNDLYSLNAKTDLSVVMLSDSYATAVNPYMMLTYKSYKSYLYSESSAVKIEQEKPDVLIIMPFSCHLGEYRILNY